MMQKNKTQLYLLMTIIFLSGIIIGGLSGIFIGSYLHTRGRPFRHFRFPRKNMRQHIFNELKYELNLSPSQEEEVEAILESVHKDYMQTRRKTFEKMHTRMEATMDKIAAVLEPDQQEKLSRFRQKMKKRFKHHRDKCQRFRDEKPETGPPPPGHP